MEQNNPSSSPHVVLLSSPGMGHLIPVLQLCKRLVMLYNFDVTTFFVGSHSSPAEAHIIQSAENSELCRIVQLPPVDISGLIDPGAAIVTQISVMMREIRPALRSAILDLKVRPAAFIVDLFGTESLVVAKELGIPNFVYFASNAWCFALLTYLPVLHVEVKGEYVDQKEPLKIPGCEAVRPEDVVDPMLDRTDQQYLECVRIGKEIPSGDGILINTWEDLQSTTLGACRNKELLGRVVEVPVYPIGPLTRPVGPSGMESELYDWLNGQPDESVVYVSFGSAGTLSQEQMIELAWGLELSQQRFIWVIRPPTVKNSDETFFTAGHGGDDRSTCLPDGFLSRTQHVGLLVPQWGPQVDILSHPSVGGFLTHCGWNSVLESLINGVPMIAWPLYAEQRMNATLLAEELGVAVRTEVLPSKQVVGRKEIEMLIKRIMVDEEGTKLRNKAKDLKHSAEMALAEGGSSYNALSEFAKVCQIS